MRRRVSEEGRSRSYLFSQIISIKLPIHKAKEITHGTSEFLKTYNSEYLLKMLIM